MEDKLKMKTEKVSAKDQILLMQRILGSYYAVKMFACYRELSLDYYQYDSAKNFKYHIRPDFVAINAKKHVIIVETKSSVSDFRSDKKFECYLDFCNQFYLATYDQKCLEAMLQEPRVVENKAIGIIHVDLEKNRTLINGKEWPTRNIIRFMRGAKKREIRTEKLDLLVNALVFRGSPFNFNGQINQNSWFYPPSFVEPVLEEPWRNIPLLFRAWYG